MYVIYIYGVKRSIDIRNTGIRKSFTLGSTYFPIWGRKSCPAINGTELIYTGTWLLLRKSNYGTDLINKFWKRSLNYHAVFRLFNIFELFVAWKIHCDQIQILKNKSLYKWII